MGKIHDALKRAEEERTKEGAAPRGATARVVSDPVLAQPRKAMAARGRRMRDARRSRVVLSGIESGVTEEYRTLRARIQSIRRQHPMTTFVVTSARPAEGKSTTALNLALSFGLEREGNTCLLDADMRTPSIHQGFPENDRPGVAELLETDAKLAEALIQVPETRLSVLTVRKLPSRPAELLASSRMVQLVSELKGHFDTVIIDAPPILGLPDATTLVDLCDAALMVVGQGQSGHADIESALERIDAAKVIGFVFNRSQEEPMSYGAAYGGARG